MIKQFSTGQVADLLLSTEPRLNDLIRRRRILPPPDVVAGRRAWSRGHILQAAIRLGISLEVIDARLKLAEERGGHADDARQQDDAGSTSEQRHGGGPR